MISIGAIIVAAGVLIIITSMFLVSICLADIGCMTVIECFVPVLAVILVATLLQYLEI